MFAYVHTSAMGQLDPRSGSVAGHPAGFDAVDPEEAEVAVLWLPLEDEDARLLLPPDEELASLLDVADVEDEPERVPVDIPVDDATVDAAVDDAETVDVDAPPVESSDTEAVAELTPPVDGVVDEAARLAPVEPREVPEVPESGVVVRTSAPPSASSGDESSKHAAAAVAARMASAAGRRPWSFKKRARDLHRASPGRGPAQCGVGGA